MLSDRPHRAAIERAHAAWIAQLPDHLVEAARQLPRRLGLSERYDADWGEVFGDVAALALPSMVLSETQREVAAPVRDAAQRAHLCAMLGARINASVDTGEVETGEDLDALLGAIERERNRALAELRMLGADRSLNFSLPERELRAARADEREVFEGRSEASIPAYLVISTAKQSLAFLAVSAAAAVEGFDIDEIGHVHELTLGSMLGMQIRDDIEAWLANPRSGHAWVSALAEHEPVLDVVVQLCELAQDALGRAAASARALGVTSLMCWARAEAIALRELQRRAERGTRPALAS